MKRLGSIGADCLDGIDGNDWRHEQFAGAGDVLGAFAAGEQAIVADAVEARREGATYQLSASHGFAPDYREWMQRQSIAIGRQTLVGRTAIEARTVHIPDVLVDPEYTWLYAAPRSSAKGPPAPRLPTPQSRIPRPKLINSRAELLNCGKIV
jgi:hypothetical protein